MLDKSKKNESKMNTLLVGVCGGTGSGKSTLVNRIKKELADEVAVINMDSFYKEQPGTTYEERTKTNYDDPSSFDVDIMLSCIKDLKDGHETYIPVYDFSIHNRSDEPWIRVDNKRIIILDGILLFAIPEVFDQLDYRIFVDCDSDIRILRRILRDNKERGRSVQSVVDQYLTTVKPMHERYIEPYRNSADIIVARGGFNEKALELIVSALKYKIM